MQCVFRNAFWEDRLWEQSSILNHLSDLGSQFGARWSLKGLQNQSFSNKISRKRVQEGVLKNIFLGWIWMLIGDAGKPKQAFRIILVANWEVPMDHKFAWKMKQKSHPKSFKIGATSCQGCIFEKPYFRWKFDGQTLGNESAKKLKIWKMDLGSRSGGLDPRQCRGTLGPNILID